jgi:hypothetical protein
MTPIGHFACAAAVAGNIDLLAERETIWGLSYYVLFLVVFAALAFFLTPGAWGMQLHDQFGNAALFFCLILWWRGSERQRLFLCVLLGGQVLAAYTHVFDRLALALTGGVPEGMWRPHVILHTPLAALVISLIAAPIVKWLLRLPGVWKTFLYLLIGYGLHIFADTITYRFPIYVLWPFSDFHGSLAALFSPPDAVSRWLGNPLSLFSPPSAENSDGFIVYWAEPLVIGLLAVLFFLRSVSRRLLGPRDV